MLVFFSELRMSHCSGQAALGVGEHTLPTMFLTQSGAARGSENVTSLAPPAQADTLTCGSLLVSRWYLRGVQYLKVSSHHACLPVCTAWSCQWDADGLALTSPHLTSALRLPQHMRFATPDWHPLGRCRL
jgi:hypothetical protein